MDLKSPLPWLVCALALWLGACSSLPPELGTPPADDPGITAVRATPGAYLGRRVRWGGVIASVNNRPDQSELTVVSRKLYDSGEPTCDEKSAGRFIVNFEGFLDPALFREGRLITISGTVAGSARKPIGDFLYLYPVIQGDAFHLWETEDTYCQTDRPPWYYDPWYPYRNYPAWRRWP